MRGKQLLKPGKQFRIAEKDFEWQNRIPNDRFIPGKTLKKVENAFNGFKGEKE